MQAGSRPEGERSGKATYEVHKHNDSETISKPVKTIERKHTAIKCAVENTDTKRIRQ